jgi:hypothetical protein
MEANLNSSPAPSLNARSEIEPMPFAAASARRMAKACVLLTFEGAGQTRPLRIECLDSRIAFLRREFPPPMRRADAAAKGIGSISEPFRKEVESVESVVIPVAVYRAEQWEAFASVPLILILYVFGQYAAFPSASSPLSNRQDDDTDGQ